MAVVVGLGLPAAVCAQGAPPKSLPAPSGNPLAIDFSKDPVLGFAHDTMAPELFEQTVSRAVSIHAGVREAEAAARAVAAEKDEARSGLFPTVDLGLQHDRSLSRQFGSDDNAVVERVRPYRRTDATATLTQNLFDWGATSDRIRAAGARERMANQDVRSTADDIALRAISAWYDVAAYRALVAMGGALDISQRDLIESVRMRIKQGLSAEGDLARVLTYTSNAQARLAGFRRSLSNAEARYAEVIGLAPPEEVRRPAFTAALPRSVDEARIAAANTPQVRSAELAATAARADWAAVSASNKPNVAGVIDAGRYGLIENDNDYDIRARVILRHRLIGGGGSARNAQAEGRYEQARAAAERVTQEAEREAAITFLDLQASHEEVAALEAAYKANRQARDVLAERFRSTQGSLTDVLNSEDSYFQIAAQYIQSVTRLDALKLVLLQRGGNLLSTLGVALPDTSQ
ncbi:TolC family protein [Sphingomonas sp. ID0503]|uniref:TolC family protein n=1 Tax=Sphingomonas sp. ID0503 TaxID=3399691 RepID=UPI003AFAEB2D